MHARITTVFARIAMNLTVGSNRHENGLVREVKVLLNAFAVNAHYPVIFGK